MFVARVGRGPAFLLVIIPHVHPWCLLSPAMVVILGVCRSCHLLTSLAFAVPGIGHPCLQSLVFITLASAGFVSLSLLSSPFVVPAVCCPPFIIVSTSNSPYEQWLIGRLMVPVMWQWWWQMLVLWGLLAIAIAM
jgi:hypothetical protein